MGQVFTDGLLIATMTFLVVMTIFGIIWMAFDVD